MSKEIEKVSSTKKNKIVGLLKWTVRIIGGLFASFSFLVLLTESSFLGAVIFLIVAAICLFPFRIKSFSKAKSRGVLISSAIVLSLVGFAMFDSGDQEVENSPEVAGVVDIVEEVNDELSEEEKLAEEQKKIEEEQKKAEEEKLEEKRKKQEEAEEKARQEEEIKKQTEEEARLAQEEAQRAEEEKIAAEKERKRREEENKPQPLPEYKVYKRDAEELLLNKYIFTGKIIEINVTEDFSNARISLDTSEFGSLSDEIIFLEYNGKLDVFEDDIVEITGLGAGQFSYESQAGWNLTLPAILVQEYKVL